MSDLAKTISGWIDEAQKRWEPVFEDMRRDDKVYNGDYGYKGDAKRGKRGKKQAWQSQVETRAAFSTVQTILPIVKDYLPTTDILDRDDNDDQFADIMQLRFNQEAKQTRLDRVKLDVVEDGLRFKNGIVKIWYEDGKIQTELQNPYSVLFDASATCVEDAAYIDVRNPMKIKDIKREYDFDAKPDAQLNQDHIWEPRERRDDEVYPNTVTNLDGENETFAEGGSNYEPDGYAFVDEVWYTDPDSGIEMFCIKINNEIVQEADNSAGSDSGYGRKPFFMFKNYGSKHQLYGYSEIELTRTIDIAYNESLNAILDNIRAAADPPRYYKNSWLSQVKAKFLGAFGKGYPVNQPDDIGYLKTPTMPQGAFDFPTMLQFLHDSTTGVQDVTQGRRPSGVTAASAIAELQEAAQTRIRYKVNSDLKDFVEDISRFILWLMLKFDQTPITLMQEDENGKKVPVEYNPAQIRESLKWSPEGAQSWEDTPFNIEVVAGEAMPKTRAEKLNFATKMAEMGFWGMEDVERFIDLPDSKARIERYYSRMSQPSPDMIEERAQVLIQQIEVEPENQEYQARLAELQELYPTIVTKIVEEAANDNAD